MPKNSFVNNLTHKLEVRKPDRNFSKLIFSNIYNNQQFGKFLQKKSFLYSAPQEPHEQRPAIQAPPHTVDYFDHFCALPMVPMFLVKEDNYFCHRVGFIDIFLPIFM